GDGEWRRWPGGAARRQRG
ncbi:hypothetical protein ACMD2_12493, partial [Ananas comosus]